MVYFYCFVNKSYVLRCILLLLEFNSIDAELPLI